MKNSWTTEQKVALLRSIAPLFPDVSDTEARLQAIQAELPEREDWQHRGFRVAEEISLPLWKALAPAYAATLAAPLGQDSAHLATSIEHWPATVAEQQVALQQLLEGSQLRQGWRDYARWFGDVYSHTNDTAQKEVAEKTCRVSYAPLREVPLYMRSMRVSCQQLVCLPLAQWKAMQEPGEGYQPAQVDQATVERLATRVAQVFNAPPLVDMEILQDGFSWDDPVVWTTSSATLTVPMSGHGMRDRWEDGWRGDCRPLPADAIAPHWRYEGFMGQIQVRLENGEEWVVTVLAPLHFVTRIALYVEWFRREAL